MAKSNYVIYKNVKVHYVQDGESLGKSVPTLFLHGWEGSVESFMFVAKEIEGEKILIDFPPFGESEKLKDVWGLEDYVNVVKLVLSRCHIERYDIVAHSFGGRVALILGCGLNVGKMVLTGCAGIKDRSLKTKCRVLGFKAKKFLCRCGLYSGEKLRGQGSADYLKLDSIMRQTFNNIINNDLRNILKCVESEVLLLWGEKDVAVPLKDAKLMQKKIKNCGLYVFDGGSHFCYIENSSAFIGAVKLFLGKWERCAYDKAMKS